MWGWGRSAKEAYLVRGLVVGMAPFGMQYGTCLPSAAAAAKSLQSCPTLCDRKDRSPPGPAVPGILQARILECVAISFSNACKWKVKVKSLSRVRLLATPWLQPTRLLHPWDFPGKSTGVGCHRLLRPASLSDALKRSLALAAIVPWLLLPLSCVCAC